MEKEEYIAISRSMLFRLLTSISLATMICFFTTKTSSALGIIPTFFITLTFFFICTVKFFPASGAWMNVRFRNYKRTRSGLSSLPSSDIPQERFLDDYRRG